MQHDQLEDARIIRLIVDDRYRVLRHVIIWVSLFVVISFSNRLSDYPEAFRYYRLLSVYFFLILICYVNMYFLVPRLFFKGRYILYLASLAILSFIFQVILKNIIDILFGTQQLVSRHRLAERGDFYEGTFILMSVILVTTMIKLFQRWIRDKERIAELANITLTMELNELRNQINPHFLFNMLNGIKALVRSDPEKATMVIMKLSEFLRYQLYENQEKTLLKSELHFLSNFLELEKLRRDNFSIDISKRISPSILNSIFLPPNLFTTFVENAVKYSADISGEGSYINIIVEIIGGKLHFTCINSKDPGYRPADEKNSGLGLANIKRRLELLYADRYELEITSACTTYHVKLMIPI